MLLFPNFLFFYFKANFKSILNSFQILDLTTYYNKSKCTGMYAQTCCYLMINFKLMKIFIFLCFHEHINSKIASFYIYFKRSKFRVLQFYPLKMNLVLEIQKIVIKEIWILCLYSILIFPSYIFH